MPRSFKLPNHASPADWAEIAAFALSLNGYEHAGSFEACAAIAARVGASFARSRDLSGVASIDLRCALFFYQRAYRHMGWPPEEGAMADPRAIFAELRGRHGDDWVREQTASGSRAGV
jgi:hypothetical protein